MKNFDLLNIDNWKKTLQNLSVNKTRESIRAQTEQKMSLNSLRLISLLTLIINSHKNYENITLSMSQISKYMGINNGKTVEIILKAFKELKAVEYNVMKNGLVIGSYKYLTDYVYHEDTNVIDIKLDLGSANYLFDINQENGYAKIIWIYTYGMKSKYGQRLYELVVLEKFRKSKEVNISINEFKGLFGLQNNYCNNYDFAKKVIIPAINDVNANTPYNLKYEIKNEKILFFLEIKEKIEIEKINSILQNNDEIKKIVDAFEILNKEADKQLTIEEYGLRKENTLKTGIILKTKSIEKLEDVQNKKILIKKKYSK